MKRIGRRLTALALALVLAAGTLGQTALASQALGTELSGNTVPLGGGTSLTTRTLWSASQNDKRTEHYVTYTPGGGIKPVVFSGNYVASTNTVATAAAQLKAQGYRVAAAMNGGFFNTDGTIVGMLVTDGVVRSLDVQNYALLGFTNDGKVFIDESAIVKKVSWQKSGGGTFTASLAGYNAYRHRNYTSEAFLYNQEFSTKVNSTTNNVNAILRPMNGGVMKMNGSLELEVVSVADTAQAGVSFNGYIPNGCYMLYAEYHTGNEWLTNGIRALTPGQRVTVSVSGVSSQWNNAAYGISGLYTLLRGGQVVSGLPSGANPYTAVGVKADGTAIFYTIDGRQKGYSIGATYTQVAQRLQELGCVAAVALDGGGSTNLGVTLPGSTAFAIVNRPSETGRRVNNSILLVSPDNALASKFDGNVDMLDTLWVTRKGSSTAVASLTVDPGETVNLSVSGGWSTQTVVLDGGAVAWRADPAIGTIDKSGVFKASNVQDGAQGSITATIGGRTVTVAVTVRKHYPFTDIASHWSADYVEQIYNLGLTNGYAQSNGTAVYRPNGQLTRGELLAFITRLLNVDTGKYADTALPFADAGSIDSWLLPYVKAMYALGVLDGTSRGGQLYADLNSNVTREAAMTLLGRVLADQVGQNLSGFSDSGSVSSWARPYVETLVAQGVVEGSNGSLNPQAYITRGEAAKLLAEINGLPKAQLTLRQTEDSEVPGPSVMPIPQPGTDTDAGPAPVQTPAVDPGGTFVTPTQRPDQSSQGKPGDIDPDFDPSKWTLDWPLFN